MQKIFKFQPHGNIFASPKAGQGNRLTIALRATLAQSNAPGIFLRVTKITNNYAVLPTPPRQHFVQVALVLCVASPEKILGQSNPTYFRQK